ncbi:MAG: hypothetical protein NTX76_05185 [Alphaproteobacteria bacterium]|nr:hypothetical protein [Alphaproteobacteria bacterium]
MTAGWLYGTRFFLQLSLVCCIGILFVLFPGDASLRWLGFSLEMPIAVMLAVFFATMACLILLHHFWRKLLDIPKRRNEYVQRKKYLRGEDLLLESLTAIVAQQPEEAQGAIKSAESLIPDHNLFSFVAGQAAFMAKDFENAEIYFKQLEQNDKTKFFGLHGLILLALNQKDWIYAETLLQKAVALRPDSPWVQQKVLKNQLNLILSGQESQIQTKNLYRFLPKEKANAHQAMLLWLKAERQKYDPALFHDLCQQAYDLVPGNVIFAVKLSESYHRRGDTKKAQKIIGVTYKISPHRLLGDAWSGMLLDVKPVEQYRSLESLSQLNPSHPESSWIMAVAAVRAHLWGQAKSHLTPLLEYGDSQLICNLMAEIEEKQFPDAPEASRLWLKRASKAPHTEGWYCKACHTKADDWKVLCPACNHMGTLEWQTIPGINIEPEQQLLLQTDSSLSEF